jgi:hypothetical protein
MARKSARSSESAAHRADLLTTSEASNKALLPETLEQDAGDAPPESSARAAGGPPAEGNIGLGDAAQQELIAPSEVATPLELKIPAADDLAASVSLDDGLMANHALPVTEDALSSDAHSLEASQANPDPESTAESHSKPAANEPVAGDSIEVPTAGSANLADAARDDEDQELPSPVNYDDEGLMEVELEDSLYRFDAGKQGTALCLSVRGPGSWRWRFLGELRWDGRDLRSRNLERRLLQLLSKALREFSMTAAE